MRLIAGLVAALALVTACSTSGRPEATAPVDARQEQRTMVMAVQNEPTGVAQLKPISTGVSDRSTARLFNAGLLLQDATLAERPYLAANVPQLNTDTWRVFPDGSMETIYRLKPNLTWHDGQPLTAQDFVFGWEVYGRLTSAPTPLFTQAEMLAPDDQTVFIRWRVSFPGAGAVDDQQLIPLPRHILEATFRERDLDRLVNLPYWSTEFIGPGPYRLERWEPGSFVEGGAFDQHVLGRPKIDRVQVRFIADENTALANFLAGEVHATAHSTLRYEQAKVLMRDWTGTVVLIPIQPRFIHVQLRPEFATPAALTDVRVRKALAHAIDKPSLDQALFDGTGAVTYSMVSPRAVPYYPEIDRAITKYPYDPRRSEQLLTEAGFTKGPDGVLVAPDGQRFTTELWGDSGVEYQRDSGAIAEGWQRVGVQAQLNFISRAQLSDNELRSKFPIYSTAAGSAVDTFAAGFTSSRVPGPGNRWQGGNRGGWSNAEYDGLSEAFDSTLDQTERARQVVQMERIVSDELPIIMLWFNFHVVAYASFISGPDTRSLRDLAVWNIHEWEMR